MTQTIHRCSHQKLHLCRLFAHSVLPWLPLTKCDSSTFGKTHCFLSGSPKLETPDSSAVDSSLSQSHVQVKNLIRLANYRSCTRPVGELRQLATLHSVAGLNFQPSPSPAQSTTRTSLASLTPGSSYVHLWSNEISTLLWDYPDLPNSSFHRSTLPCLDRYVPWDYSSFLECSILSLSTPETPTFHSPPHC